MKNWNSVILLFILIIGCKSNEKYTIESGNLIFNDYYENGNLSRTLTYDLDTVLNGEAILYYESGVIARKFNFENEKLSGFDSSFYESGNLLMFQQWLDSTLIYNQEIYYDSVAPMLVEIGGDTSIVEYSLIKSYSYMNSYGVSGFNADYDLQLNPTRISGNAIVSIFLDTTSNYDLTFLVASPPFLNGQFTIRTESDGINISESLVLENDIVDYHFKPQNSQLDHNLILGYGLTDYNDQIVYTDTVRILYRLNEFTMKRDDNDKIEDLVIASLLN